MDLDLEPWQYDHQGSRGQDDSKWYPEEGNFSHPCSGQLTPQNAVAWKLWDHWTMYAGGVMDSGIRAELDRLCKKVAQMKSGRGKELPTVLAYCGSDVGDHRLVMDRIEVFLEDYESLFGYVVRVGPRQCHTAEVAIRSICDKVMHKAAKAGEGTFASASFVDASDEEYEDADVKHVGTDGVSAQEKEICTALDLVNWYNEFHVESGQSRRRITILVDQAQLIPKDVLRNILSHCSSMTCDEGLPVIVVLGMQMKPDGQHDILEGEVKPGILPLGAFHFFDARSTCISLLEFLALDSRCPLAFDPDLLKWVRAWVDHEGHLSLSGLLKVLGMLCRHYFHDNALSCLGDSSIPMSNLSFTSTATEALVSHFRQVIQGNPSLLPELSLTLSKDPNAGSAPLSKKDLLYQRASQGAACAVKWKQRVCESLSLWNALVLAAEPQSFETPLQRMCRLWNLVWPCKDDVEQSATVQRHLAKLYRRLPEARDVDLKHLLSTLRSTCKTLHVDLTESLQSVEESFLQEPGTERQKRIRKAFDTAFSAFCSHGIWQPLEDSDARAMFRGFFEFPHSLVKDDRILSKLNPTIQASLLKAMEEGSIHEFESDFSRDLLLLYRLLELCRGKSVNVEDMWEAFKEVIYPSSDEKALDESGKAKEEDWPLLRRRFAHGIMALHTLGIVIPKERPKKGDSFERWRLHKRYFGRIWNVVAGPVATEADIDDSLTTALPENALATTPSAQICNMDLRKLTDVHVNTASTDCAAPTTPPAQLSNPELRRKLVKLNSNELPDKKFQPRESLQRPAQRAASPPSKRRRRENVVICW